MIETIFRIIIIILILTLTLAIIGSVSVNYNPNSSYINLFVDFLHIITYIIPVAKLLPLFAITIALIIFKFTVSIVKTLWGIFPLQG